LKLDMTADASLIPLDLEQALLGAILIDPDVLERVDGQVVAADFGEPVHQRLFERFLAARAAGQRIDLRLARTALGQDAGFQITPDLNVGQYIARLAAEATGTLHAKDYASTIREFAGKRRLLEIADRIKAVALGARQVTEVAIEAIEDLDVIAAARSAPHLARVNIGDAAEQFVEDMAARMQSPGSLAGVTTGFSDLDARTGGFQRGELIILAGRPGMGKSALAVSSARQSAAAGHAGIYFSLEMTAKAVSGRALTDAIFDHRDPIAYSDAAAGSLSDVQAQRIIDAQREFRLPFEIDPQGDLSVSQIAARSRKYQQALERKGKALDLIAVDHLHLIRASDRYRGNATAELTETSGALKALAKELNVPVIALAQLNRGVEGRDNKRPTLADLRQSGSIEQDADLVLMLYREAYYLTVPCSDPRDEGDRIARLMEVQNRIEVIIAKNRNGPTCTVPLFCNIAANAFRNLSRAA
jgi:replicative DNA helicase